MQIPYIPDVQYELQSYPLPIKINQVSDTKFVSLLIYALFRL